MRRWKTFWRLCGLLDCSEWALVGRNFPLLRETDVSARAPLSSPARAPSIHIPRVWPILLRARSAMSKPTSSRIGSRFSIAAILAASSANPPGASNPERRASTWLRSFAQGPKIDQPIRFVSASSAIRPRCEFPEASSPGDHAAMDALSGAMARMPPPTPLLPGKPTR